MDLTKLSKKELLDKCEEFGIKKYKSKNKSELIELITVKRCDARIVNQKQTDKKRIVHDDARGTMHLCMDDARGNDKQMVISNVENASSPTHN